MKVISHQDAQERGLPRYFTGVPCSRGHVTERYTRGSQCIACKEIYAAEHGRANHDRQIARAAVRMLAVPPAPRDDAALLTAHGWGATGDVLRQAKAEPAIELKVGTTEPAQAQALCAALDPARLYSLVLIFTTAARRAAFGARLAAQFRGHEARANELQN